MTAVLRGALLSGMIVVTPAPVDVTQLEKWTFHFGELMGTMLLGLLMIGVLGTFSLEDLCGCPNECKECCGGCCPGLKQKTLYATFSDFDCGGDPPGSYTLTYDSVNQWWGKATATFGNGYTLIFWLVCQGTASNCYDLALRYELYDESGVLLCDYTTNDTWTPLSPFCVCSPVSITFRTMPDDDCIRNFCVDHGNANIYITE